MARRQGRPPKYPPGTISTPEYKAWAAMKARCSNPVCSSYRSYGDKGIKVCERWLTSFEAFRSDVGPRPSVGHSLDRYPNSQGNYEPGNVRWATLKEQQENRIYKQYSLGGELYTIRELSQLSGISDPVIRARVSMGWPIRKALLTPVRWKRTARMRG